MRFRSLILIFLLISQPVSALNGAWQSLQSDAGATAASHCDGEQIDSAHDLAIEAQIATSDHADCETECGMCAACSAANNAAQFSVELFPADISAPMLSSLSLLGNFELLYRPPILS